MKGTTAKHSTELSLFIEIVVLIRFLNIFPSIVIFFKMMSEARSLRTCSDVYTSERGNLVEEAEDDDQLSASCRSLALSTISFESLTSPTNPFEEVKSKASLGSQEISPPYTGEAPTTSVSPAISAPAPKFSGLGSLWSSMNVFLRIRPFTSEEKFIGEESIIHSVDQCNVRLSVPEHTNAYRHGESTVEYGFTHVFDENSTQEQVFEACAKPLLEDVLTGKNALLFCYGVSNSGKSFSMIGNSENPGIIPRTIAELHARKGESCYKVEKITLSFLEIYKGNLYDLLGNEKRILKNIFKESSGHTLVRGLTECEFLSVQDAEKLLKVGSARRQVHSTAINEGSSRGHGLITFTINFQEGTDGRKQGKSRLCLVDMAGVERSKKTKNSGVRLQETGKINSSLLNLGHCLAILQRNQANPKSPPEQVPFRASKLTRLLQDYIVGNGKTSMIINIYPGKSDFDEKLHALNYSAVARQIVTRVEPIKLSEPKRIKVTKKSFMSRFKRKAKVDLSQSFHSISDSNSCLTPSVKDNSAAIKIKELEAELKSAKLELFRTKRRLRDECLRWITFSYFNVNTQNIFTRWRTLSKFPCVSNNHNPDYMENFSLERDCSIMSTNVASLHELEGETVVEEPEYLSSSDDDVNECSKFQAIKVILGYSLSFSQGVKIKYIRRWREKAFDVQENNAMGELQTSENSECETNSAGAAFDFSSLSEWKRELRVMKRQRKLKQTLFKFEQTILSRNLYIWRSHALLLKSEYQNNLVLQEARKRRAIEKICWILHEQQKRSIQRFFLNWRFSSKEIDGFETKQLQPLWIPDELRDRCEGCCNRFNWIRRKHHCRSCGHVYCNGCSKDKIFLPWNSEKKLRVCFSCREKICNASQEYSTKDEILR